MPNDGEMNLDSNHGVDNINENENNIHAKDSTREKTDQDASILKHEDYELNKDKLILFSD